VGCNDLHNPFLFLFSSFPLADLVKMTFVTLYDTISSYSKPIYAIRRSFSGLSSDKGLLVPWACLSLWICGCHCLLESVVYISIALFTIWYHEKEEVKTKSQEV
jgi:hypothetical protein